MECKRDIWNTKDYQYTVYHRVEDMRVNQRQIKENQPKIKSTHSEYPAVKIMKEDEFHPNTLKITSRKTDKKLICIKEMSFQFYCF